MIKIKRSIEGGKFKTIIIEKELFDALFEYKQVNEAWLYFETRGLKHNIDEIFKIVDNCENIFRKYNLDKFDVRAKYKFNESIIIE
jgi:hypothetical protein